MGLSAPSAPPFLPVLSAVFSLTLPGVAFLMMRTASAFFAPGCNCAVTSKRAAHESAFDAAQLLRR